VLAVIRFARAAGFTMVELKQLFRGFREGTPASARWSKLARHKIAEMDALINKATAVKRMLHNVCAAGVSLWKIVAVPG
jgi:DNA-binding transcriptional MerR regulator